MHINAFAKEMHTGIYACIEMYFFYLATFFFDILYFLVPAGRQAAAPSRDEFGIGLALSAAGRALVDRQNARLGRALQRLSVDLYRKDSHFVLELIQNADDNAYADAARAWAVRAQGPPAPPSLSPFGENCHTR